MSDICKINISTLRNYADNFKNESNNFNNKAYSTFSSSYLKNCSDPYVRTMASKLLTLYTAIKNGYTNIGDWWSGYVENISSLESFLSGGGSVGAMSEASVRNSANGLPALETFNINISATMTNSSSTAIGVTFVNNGLGSPNNMFGGLFSGYDVSSIDTNDVTNANVNMTSESKFWEKAKNVAEGFLNWGKDAAEVVVGTIKSVHATNAVAIFSLAEKTLTDLGFDVAEGFDNFYGNTKFGQGLVENSYVSTDVAENVSKKVKNVATSVENVVESVGASKAVAVISAAEKTLTDLGFDVEDKFDNFYGNTKFGQNLVEKSYVSTDVAENVSNWVENTVKSVGATEAVAVISVAEKTLTDLGFDVEDKFDNFYGNTKFGQGLVENSYVSTDVAENVSNWIENAATIVGNTIKSVKATAAVAVTSVVEQGAELLGIDATQAFDNFYENTKVGQNLVNNAYASYDEIRSGKVLESVGATVATAAISVIEGIGTLAEAIVDTATIAVTGYRCISDPTILLKDINAYLKTGDASFSNTKEFFKPTMSFVSEKWVTGCLDLFYENTDAGNWIKENSYGFDTVRSVGTGVGYVIGVVALTILTCGVFGVAAGGAGAAGAAGATGVATASTASTMSFQTMMGLVAGYAGFGKGAEQAWGNGADLGEGLVVALATGIWEGFQMWAGAQIGAPNGWGTQLASKVVGSNANAVVQKVVGSFSRLVLDTVDGALEGFVVPAIDAIYKDGYIDKDGNYIEFTDDNGLFKRYAEVFDDAGGWKNVGIQGAVGFITSFAGETID